MPTMNISVTPEQSRLINREVESGHYASASEVVREALRIWRERQTEKDIAALQTAHAGAFDRDTTPEEMANILILQKEARAELKRSKRK